MPKGFHFGHNRTRRYAAEFRRIYSRSFKKLINGPLGSYTIANDWLEGDQSKFERIKCKEWPLVMLFNIHGKETPIPLGTDDRSACTKLYLICPYCVKQKQHLHVTKRTFACAKCLKLNYASQSENEQDRLARRIRKLRSNTWGYDWPDKNNLTELSYFWPKPKGMHQSTFSERKNKLRALEATYWNLAREFVDRIYN